MNGRWRMVHTLAPFVIPRGTPSEGILWVQGPVAARSWGFKSPLPHTNIHGARGPARGQCARADGCPSRKRSRSR